MINQQLIDYIKTEKLNGFSDTDIRSILLKNNWTTVDIDIAFNSINKINNLKTSDPFLNNNNKFHIIFGIFVYIVSLFIVLSFIPDIKQFNIMYFIALIVHGVTYVIFLRYILAVIEKKIISKIKNIYTSKFVKILTLILSIILSFIVASLVLGGLFALYGFWTLFEECHNGCSW